MTDRPAKGDDVTVPPLILVMPREAAPRPSAVCPARASLVESAVELETLARRRHQARLPACPPIGSGCCKEDTELIACACAESRSSPSVSPGKGDTGIPDPLGGAGAGAMLGLSPSIFEDIADDILKPSCWDQPFRPPMDTVR